MHTTIQKAIKNYLNNHNVNKIDLKSVLFDMDGVLFDSMPYHAQSWNKAMDLYGLNLPVEEAFLHEGRTGKGTINIVMQRQKGREATSEECEAIYSKKSELFNSFPLAKPMHGAIDVVRTVHNSGLTSQIVTGSGQASLLGRIEENYPNLFEHKRMIAAKDVIHGKPNPEPYLKGLEKGKLKPNEAIVIENAPLGVEAAHKAQIFTIAVNTGPMPDRVLTNAGADLLFPSMEALNKSWNTLYNALSEITKEGIIY